jgi:hypothetical protein
LGERSAVSRRPRSVGRPAQHLGPPATAPEVVHGEHEGTYGESREAARGWRGHG